MEPNPDMVPVPSIPPPAIDPPPSLQLKLNIRKRVASIANKIFLG
jgi:hypothetical protein